MPDGHHTFERRHEPLEIPRRDTDHIGIITVIVFSLLASLAVPAIVLKSVEIIKRPLVVEQTLRLR